MDTITISWVEEDHKIRGGNEQDFERKSGTKLNLETLRVIARWMIKEDPSNLLGIYQRVHVWTNGDYMNMEEVPEEVIRQILHWYIDIL